MLARPAPRHWSPEIKSRSLLLSLFGKLLCELRFWCCEGLLLRGSDSGFKVPVGDD